MLSPRPASAQQLNSSRRDWERESVIGEEGSRERCKSAGLKTLRYRRRTG